MAAGDPPPVGEDMEFDTYVWDTFGVIDPSVSDLDDIRRAAWRTRGTSGPSTTSTESSHLASGAAHDDELERALELSRQELLATDGGAPGSSRDTAFAVDDDDDEDLQKAIAMSQAPMTDAARSRAVTPEEERRMVAQAMAASMQQPQEVLDSDSDDEIELLNAAAEASRKSFREEQERTAQASGSPSGLSPASRSTSGSSSTTTSQLAASTALPAAETTAPAGPTILGGLGGIDRATLERERLARQAARQGVTTAPTSSSAAGASASAAAPSTSSSLPHRRTNHPLQSVGTFPSDDGGEYYLDGELRHVSLDIGQRTTDPTFSIREIFAGHEQMSLLINCSFVTDEEWVRGNSILPSPKTVPTIRIMHTRDSSLHGQVQGTDENEAWIWADMKGRSGSAHMKFAWIFYKTGRLRVVIMTANMVDYDFEQIENTVFIQDFLPAKDGSSNTAKGADFAAQFSDLFNHFPTYKTMKYFLAEHPRGQTIPYDSFRNFQTYFDWSRVAVRLVMSIPGNYQDSSADREFTNMSKYGICRLGKVLHEEGWKPQKGERVVAEYQNSSCGVYHPAWFNMFYRMISGGGVAAVSRMPEVTSWGSNIPPIKVVFPSLATVDASEIGRNGGGTMFCGVNWEKNNLIARGLYHDARSKRGGVLMHTKMLLAVFEPAPATIGTLVANGKGAASQSSIALGKRKADEITATDDDVGGWVYLGSHNFGPSPWGTVNFKKGFTSINNYEMGIVFPLSRKNAREMADVVAPHKRPAPVYSANDEPWSQGKHMPGGGRSRH